MLSLFCIDEIHFPKNYNIKNKHELKNFHRIDYIIDKFVLTHPKHLTSQICTKFGIIDKEVQFHCELSHIEVRMDIVVKS